MTPRSRPRASSRPRLAAVACLLGVLGWPGREAAATVDANELFLGTSPDGQHYYKAVGGLVHVDTIARCAFVDHRCTTIHTLTIPPGQEENPRFRDLPRWWPTIPVLARLALSKQGLEQDQQHRGLRVERVVQGGFYRWEVVGRCGRRLLARTPRHVLDSHPAIARIWWDRRLRFVVLELHQSSNTELLGALLPADYRSAACLRPLP